jgi:hypothetical protein
MYIDVNVNSFYIDLIYWIVCCFENCNDNFYVEDYLINSILIFLIKSIISNQILLFYVKLYEDSSMNN